VLGKGGSETKRRVVRFGKEIRYSRKGGKKDSKTREKERGGKKRKIKWKCQARLRVARASGLGNPSNKGLKGYSGKECHVTVRRGQSPRAYRKST